VPLPGEMRTEPLQVSVYAGRYAVDSEIGRGAIGARAARAGREDSAVRSRSRSSLRERGGSDSSRKARAAGALNHPNIIAVYDVGEHDGEPFIAASCCRADVARGAPRRPVAAAEVLDFAVQLADGLGRGAQSGIVHRDLKPENLFVTTAAAQDPRFSESRSCRSRSEAFRTEAGTVLGTRHTCLPNRSAATRPTRPPTSSPAAA